MISTSILEHVETSSLGSPKSKNTIDDDQGLQFDHVGNGLWEYNRHIHRLPQADEARDKHQPRILPKGDHVLPFRTSSLALRQEIARCTG